MKNRVVVSPFFLDQDLPPLERFASGGRQLNKPQRDGGDRLARMSAVHQPLARFVAQAVREGDRPVSIAGDCCAPIGVLAGLQAAGLQPTIVWLDAHGDFNTPETSPSGFIAGMALAMIVGRGDQELTRAAGLVTHPEAGVFLADARDLDPGEADALRNSAVHHVPRLADLPQRLPASPLYVHLDVDVLSPSDAPATLYPTAGGPSLAEACAVMESLAATGQVAAVSMTVWDFGQDGDGRTERACTQLLQALVGEW
ncbi:MAG TPA: arginase family protein [Thermoanaerobaculia bacterium]|jgi:arginase|nr:arginase family protein [Thermoanaerobaculia bacterium]